MLPFPLVIGGFVLHRHVSEKRGRGDLRAYLLVQFLPLIVIAFMTVLLPAPAGRNVPVVAMLLAYAAAKILEVLDQRVFAIHGVISGHTLKHLVAAAGTFLLVLAIGESPVRRVIE
jgi:hypothetical protein